MTTLWILCVYANSSLPCHFCPSSNPRLGPPTAKPIPVVRNSSSVCLCLSGQLGNWAVTVSQAPCRIIRSSVRRNLTTATRRGQWGLGGTMRGSADLVSPTGTTAGQLGLLICLSRLLGQILGHATRLLLLLQVVSCLIAISMRPFVSPPAGICTLLT